MADNPLVDTSPLGRLQSMIDSYDIQQTVEQQKKLLNDTSYFKLKCYFDHLYNNQHQYAEHKLYSDINDCGVSCNGDEDEHIDVENLPPNNFANGDKKVQHLTNLYNLHIMQYFLLHIVLCI